MATPETRADGARVTVFISSASEDRELHDKLVKHLLILTRHGLAFSEDLDHADLVLLLVSSDYLALAIQPGSEADRAHERSQRGETAVIPVILRPCLWERSWFGRVQALPRSQSFSEPIRPVATWDNPDDVLSVVATGIGSVVDRMLSTR
jgi:hypothetical protein